MGTEWRKEDSKSYNNSVVNKKQHLQNAKIIKLKLFSKLFTEREKIKNVGELPVGFIHVSVCAPQFGQSVGNLKTSFFASSYDWNSVDFSWKTEAHRYQKLHNFKIQIQNKIGFTIQELWNPGFEFEIRFQFEL